MAEIENQTNQRKLSSKYLHKKNIRVDLTPMVDLGFLLITFFIFTTTLAKPTVMKLYMPDDKNGPGDPVCASCVLTVFPAKDNSILFYEGDAGPNTVLKKSNYSEDGIRQVILQKKKSVMMVRGTLDDFVLIIKPLPESSFQNFVDLLDEVAINNVKHYYISDADKNDEAIIAKQ